MGGVLCPQAGCGMGMLPEDTGNRVTCPTCRVSQLTLIIINNDLLVISLLSVALVRMLITVATAMLHPSHKHKLDKYVDIYIYIYRGEVIILIITVITRGSKLMESV